MATSGSTNFTINRDEIIRLALMECKVIGKDQTPDNDDIDVCADKLNLMVKAWMGQGIHLWAVDEATLFLSVGTQTYSLGATGTHCTNSYVSTTLSTDEATSSTSIGLTSTTGMSASDNIGIVLDDGTIHWTTISGAPGSPTTIATGLASAATAGNVVFAYASKINRPQRLLEMYRRDINDGDTPIAIIGRAEYTQLSNKTTQGKPIQAFYDKQLTNGVLYVWPTPDLSTDVIRFWYERTLEDFDASTDNPDFPIEWGEALYYGLADRISRIFGTTKDVRDEIKQDAQVKLALAMSYDEEETSTFFQPDFR